MQMFRAYICQRPELILNAFLPSKLLTVFVADVEKTSIWLISRYWIPRLDNERRFGFFLAWKVRSGLFTTHQLQLIYTSFVDWDHTQVMPDFKKTHLQEWMLFHKLKNVLYPSINFMYWLFRCTVVIVFEWISWWLLYTSQSSALEVSKEPCMYLNA